MTRIDLKTDPRVFAVLDDGCNRTCHTPAFIDHVRAVLESEGKELKGVVTARWRSQTLHRHWRVQSHR